jgi:hypothetical protein
MTAERPQLAAIQRRSPIVAFTAAANTLRVKRRSRPQRAESAWAATCSPYRVIAVPAFAFNRIDYSGRVERSGATRSSHQSGTTRTIVTPSAGVDIDFCFRHRKDYRPGLRTPPAMSSRSAKLGDF